MNTEGLLDTCIGCFPVLRFREEDLLLHFVATQDFFFQYIQDTVVGRDLTVFVNDVVNLNGQPLQDVGLLFLLFPFGPPSICHVALG